MRVLCTLLGVCIIPFGFLTIWTLTRSLSAASMSAMLLIFDGGFATLNRYILLDPLLIFFMTGSVLTHVRFRALPPSQSFSAEWWTYLSLTGAMLVSTFSVKFVGLFIILYVGVNTAYDLWSIFGDVANSLQTFVKHLLARCLCLIAVPILLYVSFYFIHFRLLTKTGQGNAHYGARFQMTLEDNEFKDAEFNKYVEFGSVITLKASFNFPCAYLHSHHQEYPEGLTKGEAQQMVTNYVHRDDNNHFLVKRWAGDNKTGEDNFVRHGDLVILEHVNTRRNLHSHNTRALVAKNHYQVTGYGEEGVGDDNDVWRIEVEGGRQGDRIETLVSVIRVRHHFLKCLLSCTLESLPVEWGFHQHEVACSPWQRQTNEMKGMRRSTWVVEENNVTSGTAENTRLGASGLAMGWLEKFITVHKVMLFFNSKLGEPNQAGVPDWADMGKQPAIKWPFNIISQPFSPIEPKTYLLGNPRIWILNLAVLFIFPVILGMRIILTRDTSVVDMFSSTSADVGHLRAATMLFTLWALHYFPFFFMFRILYLHHYFPAVYFSSLLTGVILDWGIKTMSRYWPQQISPTIHFTFLLCFTAMLVHTFVEFSPLVYGMTGDKDYDKAKFSNSSYHHLYWMDWWDF